MVRKRRSVDRSPSEPSGSAGAASRWQIATAVVLIALAALAAYSNSFDGPFVFDDVGSIPANPTIQHLGQIGQVLSPPCTGDTVTGRPVLNLSLAIDYAMSGTAVRGYHVTNLVVHVLVALLLFDILRRTLEKGIGDWRLGIGGSGKGEKAPSPCHRVTVSPCHASRAALWLAAAVALLWVVHPLQTESVTYIVQRAESLVALFYLLTLYCVIRGAEDCPGFSNGKTGLSPSRAASEHRSQATGLNSSPGTNRRLVARPALWYATAVLACLLGMATKELMVTAPAMVLLYDRAFLAGSFGEALRRRWALYLGLAATWGLLAYLMLATGVLGHPADFTPPSARAYACTQPAVILYYLRLCVWPDPLRLDYDWPLATTAREILLPMLAVGAMAAATLGGVIRRKPWGFLGAWFFLILAPTSSIVPLADLAFEHRMYLPLAAVLALAVVGGYAGCQALARRGVLPRPVLLATGGCLIVAAIAALGERTYRRNEDYRSALWFYQDTAAKAPNKARVHANLSQVLNELGRTDEAIAEAREALRIDPDYVGAHCNLGNVLIQKGQLDAAAAHYRTALRLKPDFSLAQNNLGTVLAHQGKLDEAIIHYRRAVAIEPDWLDAHKNLASALTSKGNLDEAAAQYRKMLEINPDWAEAHDWFGSVLVRSGRFGEAIAQYETALRIRPDYLPARNDLGVVLRATGRVREAVAQWREGLRRSPDDPGLLNATAWVLATSPDPAVRNGAEAIILAQRAVQVTAGRLPRPLDCLAAAYAEAGRFSEAMEVAGRARSLAAAQGNRGLAETIEQRIKRYQAGLPFRDATEPAPGSGP